MSAVRAFWRWCIDMGYTTNDPFRKYSIKSQSFGTPFYLTTEERDRLYQCDLRKMPKVQMARDIFIFQCYVGCRRGDLFNLTKDNVAKTDNGIYIQYIPSKTKDERPRTVKVYLTQTAIDIMERYKKSDPRHLFPFIGAGQDNDLIKQALYEVGIDRVVTVRNKTTGETAQRHLYEVGTSHMARRTFVGNLYKKVKDPNLVGKLSGHCEGSKAFARYRDIDNDMIREMKDLLE
jgi:integrase